MPVELSSQQKGIGKRTRCPEEEGKEAVLKASALIDPWKNELQYVPNPGEDPPFELISFGPDGMEGSEDDLDYHALDDLDGEEM